MQPLPHSVIIFGFLALFLIGLEPSRFGPAFVALKAHYELEPGSVSTLVTAHFLGVTLGPKKRCSSRKFRLEHSPKNAYNYLASFQVALAGKLETTA